MSMLQQSDSLDKQHVVTTRPSTSLHKLTPAAGGHLDPPAGDQYMRPASADPRSLYLDSYSNRGVYSSCKTDKNLFKLPSFEFINLQYLVNYPYN